MNDELLNEWELIVQDIPTYILSDGIGRDTETAYLLDLTTKDKFETANQYLKEMCFEDYAPIPERYIGDKVIMEYDTNGGNEGDWYSIHGTVDEYLENARKTLLNHIKEMEEEERALQMITETEEDAADPETLSKKIYE